MKAGGAATDHGARTVCHALAVPYLWGSVTKNENSSVWFKLITEERLRLPFLLTLVPYPDPEGAQPQSLPPHRSVSTWPGG